MKTTDVVVCINLGNILMSTSKSLNIPGSYFEELLGL